MAIVDLGGLELDSRVLSKQIKQDLRDDWFMDPIEYRDMLDEDIIAHKLVANIATHHGVYSPSPVSVFDIPKKNFTLRYSIEKSLYDRVYYHGLSVFLMNFFDPLFSSRSFSHRLQPDADKRKKFLYKNGVEQWNEFRGAVRAKVSGKFLLETDVNSYFENIEIDRIKARLLEAMPRIKADGIQKMKVRRAIDLLFSCLPNWTLDSAAGRGLPQNRDASSFLANVFMDHVDKCMIERGYDYYRYMDDIKVVCDSESQARLALMDLVGMLRKDGLGLNSQKTQIHPPGSHIAELFQDRRIQYIDALLRTRKELSIYKALEEIVAYTELLISEQRTQDRAFRYCIRKLEKLVSCQDFAFNRRILLPLSDVVVNEMDKSPVSTDQFVDYLRAVDVSDRNWRRLVDFLLDEQRSIYSWQNYQLWKLFIAKGKFSRRLLSKAVAEIRREATNEANRAGAVLYVGRFGGEKQKRLVAKQFKCCGGFMAQRASLIAVQDLRYGDIEEDLSGLVHLDLVGVLRRLKRGSKYSGCYHVDPEPVSMKSLFDIADDVRGY